MKTSLLVLCLTVARCLSLKVLCPSLENIKPCSCQVGQDKKPWISCESVSSVKELQKAIAGMQSYQLSTFTLDKSNIGVLPADAFSNLEIQDLKILFTNLESLSESPNRPPFLGLERSLESLEIRDGFRNDTLPLTRLSISHLKKLTLLQLEGNLIPTIGNDWFESGPYSLRDLYLLDTDTSKVGSHAFASLSNLKSFSLTGGHVAEITRDMFPMPALSLISLDFSNNRLTSLPKNLFSSMPSLEEVYFENNDLTSINEVVFSQIWNQLDHVHFFGNPLNCDGDMKWIYKYRLPESLHGQCATPFALKERSLGNITLADFQ